MCVLIKEKAAAVESSRLRSGSPSMNQQSSAFVKNNGESQTAKVIWLIFHYLSKVVYYYKLIFFPIKSKKS